MPACRHCLIKASSRGAISMLMVSCRRRFPETPCGWQKSFCISMISKAATLGSTCSDKVLSDVCFIVLLFIKLPHHTLQRCEISDFADENLSFYIEPGFLLVDGIPQ